MEKEEEGENENEDGLVGIYTYSNTPLHYGCQGDTRDTAGQSEQTTTAAIKGNTNELKNWEGLEMSSIQLQDGQSAGLQQPSKENKGTVLNAPNREQQGIRVRSACGRLQNSLDHHL